MQNYKRATVDERDNQNYGVSTWKAGILSKTENGLFFYCGQKPSCNFFVPRMIVVISKMPLQCGETRTRNSQDATITSLVLVIHFSFAQIKKIGTRSVHVGSRKKISELG